MQFLYQETELRSPYNVSIRQFPNGEYLIKKYEEPIRIKESGFEPEYEESEIEESAFQKLIKENPIEEQTEFRADNLSRTRQAIKYLVWNNFDKFKSFITLTFRENITDPVEAYKKLRNWLIYIKRIYPEFEYLIVPEAQKRGAIHFHILSNIPCDSVIIPKREPIKTYNEEKKRYYDLYYYDIKGWPRKKNGYSSAFDIINNTDSNFRIEFYLMKYITKEKLPESFFGKQKYYHSKNIRVPKTQYCRWTDEEFELFMTTINPSNEIRKKAIHTANEYCPDFEEITVISSRTSVSED